MIPIRKWPRPTRAARPTTGWWEANWTSSGQGSGSTWKILITLCSGMSGLVKECKKKTERPADRGSYWFSPANHLDLEKQIGSSEIQGFGSIICIPKFGVVRLAEMIVHRHSRTLEDVSRADVFVRSWRIRRWHDQRRHCSARLALPLVFLALLCISGCQGNTRASLEKKYAEARLQFLQGFADQPLQLAEAGYKESARYPDLNWKFRVLTAEARVRKGQFHPGT